jgi:hypothetical protein
LLAAAAGCPGRLCRQVGVVLVRRPVPRFCVISKSVTPQAGDRYGKGPEIRRIKSANGRRRFVHEGSFQAPCLRARPPSHDPEAWPPACRSRRQLLGPSDRPRPSLARRRCRDTRFRRPLDFRARKGPHASPTRSQVTHGAAPDRS